MDRKHSWYFYVLTYAIALLLVGHILWKYSPLKNEIESYAIEKLREYTESSVLIQDFSIGFQTVTLSGISLTDRKATNNIELEELRIGFNPFKFITENFNFQKAISSITLYQPRVIHYVSEPSEKDTIRITPELILKKVISNLQRVHNINQIRIEDGVIYRVDDSSWKDDTQSDEIDASTPSRNEWEIVLFEGLTGDMRYLPSRNLITLDLQGTLGNTGESVVQIRGYLDSYTDQMNISLIFDDCKLTTDWPFWKLDHIQLENAYLDGIIHLTNQDSTFNHFNLSGTVEARDFRASFFNQKASAEHIRMRFLQDTLIIDPFPCQIEDGQGTFYGSIRLFPSPIADWYLEAEDYSVTFLEKSHDIFEYADSGKVKGKAHFYGPLRKLQIDADLFCPQLQYAVVPFHSVETNLHYDVASKLLTFNHLRADFFNFRTQGEGEVNFSNNQMTLNLISDIFVPPGYFTLLNRLNGSTIFLRTRFQGDISTKLFGGNFRYYVEGEDTLISHGGGPFTLDNQLFKFNIQSQNFSPVMLFTGEIEDVFSNPRLMVFDIKNFPVETLTLNPLLASWIHGRPVNIYFSGPYYSLASKLKILSRTSSTPIVTVSGNIRDIFLDTQQFRGNFLLNTAPQKLDGTFEIGYTRHGVNIQLNSKKLFQGELFVGNAPDSPFNGTIHLYNFSVADYLANNPRWAQIITSGELQGDMQIRGTVKNPSIQFDLKASDFIVNKIGYYNTRLAGSLEDYSLNFKDLWLTLNGVPVINADMKWDLLKDSLYLTIKGEDIESNFLSETLFPGKEMIQGKFTYAIVLNGNSSHPVMYGDIQIREGNVKGNPFQNIIITFEDSLTANGDFWTLKDHLFKIRKFLYINKDEYTIEGKGIIGVDKEAPLDITLNIQGNVLAELPKLNPYFRNPQSYGFIKARVTGSRAVPVLKQLKMQVVNGYLEFDGILPPLTNLQMEAELDESGTFIHINTIEGYLLNHWARIYNIEHVEVDGRPLQPWYFEDVDINLGILVLETDPRGIPLSIPGLMEEGDIGYFAAAGLHPDEKFYFAGPPNLPYARGKVTLFNSRVTFPFIGMYEDGEFSYAEENQVIDFLMNMRWDVMAVPGKNNRYFVNIPAYVGEVFMDLNIDNSSPGLHFTGRLIDDSFRTEGKVESSRGLVEYLDVKFRVERFGAEFNRFEIFPEVYGKAYTTVRDTTSDFPIDIYLVLYVIDPVTKKEVNKGRWEDFRFKLVSQNQMVGETQEQVLAYLGYSVQNLQNKAEEVGLTMTENYLIRPLFRPLERQLERMLRLDYVRLRSRFTTNLFYLSFQDRAKLFNRLNYNTPNIVNLNLDPALLLLQSSEFTMGKYLLRNVYVAYSGLLVSGYEESKLGLNHSLMLEFRLLSNLLLETQYDKFQFNPFYNSSIDNDFRVRLRYSVTF
ncbi:MAG: hypothetical protein D6748_01225 [Calditrichaeota bacterium]|nr:MAG: hypothetical protein D6748_01225 [Calditrichota bacterium]